MWAIPIVFIVVLTSLMGSYPIFGYLVTALIVGSIIYVLMVPKLDDHAKRREYERDAARAVGQERAHAAAVEQDLRAAFKAAQARIDRQGKRKPL